MSEFAKKAKTLTGSELGWILRLAEQHLDSDEFQQHLKRNNLEPLRQFLNLLMAKFHPNNFNVGNSKTTWFLVRLEDAQRQIDRREIDRLKNLLFKYNKEVLDFEQKVEKEREKWERKLSKIKRVLIETYAYRFGKTLQQATTEIDSLFKAEGLLEEEEEAEHKK